MRMAVKTVHHLARVVEAAMLYVREMVNGLEGYLGGPVDEYTPPVPPWR
jgi:hypothetical protein